MIAISKRLQNVPICQLPAANVDGFLLTSDLLDSVSYIPHCTEVAVLMHHHLQTSRACGVMFLPSGDWG